MGIRPLFGCLYAVGDKAHLDFIHQSREVLGSAYIKGQELDARDPAHNLNAADSLACPSQGSLPSIPDELKHGLVPDS